MPEEKGGIKQGTGPGFFTFFKIVFRESFHSTPWVFKQLTFKFIVFWLPVSLSVLFLIKAFFKFESSSFSLYLTKSWIFLIGDCFFVFIVPYFVFIFLYKKGKLNVESGVSQSELGFKGFLTENIWPLVLNHIKAFFVIFAYLFLLIIPGIIKALRFLFLAQTVFFDENFKQEKISALKASHNVTRGRLFLIICFMICLSLVSLFIDRVAKAILPSNLELIVLFVVDTYCTCFYFIVMTQFYFVLKKAQNGVKIS